MIRQLVLFLYLLLAFQLHCFAWGKRGHNIVAEIAFHYLSDNDKAKLLSYLQGMSIEEASTWMDEVINQPRYKYTAPWHYVDFPAGTNYQPTDKANVVNAVIRYCQ